MHDLLYILYKHKGKILIFSILGFAASAAVYWNREPLYESQAKLLVRYVLNRNTVDPFQSQMNPGGGPGDQVINTEMEILKSEDLALAVAAGVGVDRLLPEAGGTAAVADAAGVILGNLEVTAVPLNNVIYLNYGNPDPELSPVILKELVTQYFVKHLEIHRSAAAFDVVAKQADEVRLQLRQTESELDKLRTDSGITSLADATSALSSQEARTREELMTAKAELADQTARIKSIEKSTGARDTAENGDLETGSASANEPSQVPAHILNEYKACQEVLSILHKRDTDLKLKFKSGNRLIATNRQQIDDNEAKSRSLIADYPDLANGAALVQQDPQNPKWDLLAERAKLASITARVEVYNSHLNELKVMFNEQYALGARIDVIERRKQMEDAEYRSLELNLKNAKIDQTLDPSRMPNITIVQHPSKPVKTYDKITQKIVLGLAGGGMALGVGLALLIELLFDRRIKRPNDIHARLQLPLLLSIPYIRRKERGGLLLPPQPDIPRIGVNGNAGTLAPASAVRLPHNGSGQADHFILPYSETIRDRMIFNFEVNNLTHKPKLVAVTGLSAGAGASTIAAGLAKSFSEMNGVKVLLVDLSSNHSEQGLPSGELPTQSLSGALQLARNTKFKQSSQNLYHASATARRDDTGLTNFSSMQLYELMPHLQASDFDYIIFDMPAIDQTSRTLTMAGLMDKVLLVLDGENTSRDALKWGYSELVKGRADVSCIFNKTRSHAPDWLIGKS